MSEEKEIESFLVAPDAWQFDYFQNENGDQLRYGWNSPENPRTLIILAEGRTETAEEYFELIRFLNENGYACAIMDWQGQGESYRYNNDNSRHHSKGVDQDLKEFNQFVKLLDDNNALNTLPKIVTAHSMGANYTLRYIAEFDHQIEGAYLIAPMLGLKPKRFIRYAAATILAVVRKRGWGTKYAFGQTKWNPVMANIVKYKISTHPIRREVQPYLFNKMPSLQCGGVTFGWVDAALQSIKKLRDPNYCASIKIPILMAIAEKDFVVDNDGASITANLLPHCQTEIFTDAQHQIHRERDEVMERFLKSFLGFCEKVIA